MIAKKFRLPIQGFLKEKDKKAIIKKGKCFIIKAVPNRLAYSRFGVVISKKISPLAVRRNKIKRILFNFVQKNKINPIPGLDILIIISPTARDSGKSELEADLENILNTKYQI